MFGWVWASGIQRPFKTRQGNTGAHAHSEESSLDRIVGKHGSHWQKSSRLHREYAVAAVGTTGQEFPERQVLREGGMAESGRLGEGSSGAGDDPGSGAQWQTAARADDS